MWLACVSLPTGDIAPVRSGRVLLHTTGSLIFHVSRYAGYKKRRGLAYVKAIVFHFLQRNALRAHEQFRIPPHRVFELSGQKEF
jgi:K+ transporter